MAKIIFTSKRTKDEYLTKIILLYLIAQSVEHNQRIYDRLNVRLRPQDNRGEAFYATAGEYGKLIEAAETGHLSKESISVMYDVVRKAPAALIK